MFCKVYSGDKGCLLFYLVYSSNITVAEAIACAYTLASVDKISDIALMLRSAIRRGFQESKALPWPPTPDDLATVDIPQELITFLNIVIARKPDVSSDKVHRLILSIGQDLCRCVTGGDCKLPKHVLLCMTVRHLYRSKHLATILNRLGHCESYDFGLELETAMAKALDETSTLLTPQIVKGEGTILFHSEWDNLNTWTQCCQFCWWHNGPRGSKLLTMKTNNKMAKLTSSQRKVIKTHMTHCYDSSGILVNS